MTHEIVPAHTATTVQEKNLKVLDYIHGRLDERTSQGQCILHIGHGGEIRRIEWRATEKVEDIVG